MRRVPFFNYPTVFTSEEEDLIRIFVDVGRRGAFIMQKDVTDFEHNLAEYVGAGYAVGVGNATDGLYFMLVAGGIRPGDEVIICSHTMMATAAAIHFAGGVSVPVEVGPDRLIDYDSIEAAITPRTRALMPTHLNGRTCDMDRIEAICGKHDLLLFEDAAQALGSKWRGKCAGTFGLASAISFYPAKTLGCLGDGGAVITSDSQVYEKLLLLRSFGQDADGRYVMWAMNSRLDNLQAAILGHRLTSYDRVISRRRGIAAHYQRRLGHLRQLDLPAHPDSDLKHFDIYQNYEVVAEDRDRLKAFLHERGVGTLVQWRGQPVHQQQSLGFTQHLPRTDVFFERCLMLPLNMAVSDEDTDYVCDQMEAFYRGH